MNKALLAMQLFSVVYGWYNKANDDGIIDAKEIEELASSIGNVLSISGLNISFKVDKKDI